MRFRNGDYKISLEDQHTRINYLLSSALKDLGCKVPEIKSIFQKEEFQNLSLQDKVKYLVILKSNNQDQDQDQGFILSATLLHDQEQKLKGKSIEEYVQQYSQKSKKQVYLEALFKILGVALFVGSVASLVYFMSPLIIVMVPALSAYATVLCSAMWVTLFLARIEVTLKSGFWCANRMAEILCNFGAFWLKWGDNKCLLLAMVLPSILNAGANMAFAFLAPGVGLALSVCYAISLFFTSLAITSSPLFCPVKPDNNVENCQESTYKGGIIVKGGIVSAATKKEEQPVFYRLGCGINSFFRSGRPENLAPA